MPEGKQHIAGRALIRTSSFLQPGAVVRCFVAFFLAFSLFPVHAFAADSAQVLTTSPTTNTSASTASSAATSTSATSAAPSAQNAANTPAAATAVQGSASLVVTETITLGVEPLNLIQNGNYKPELTPAISSAYATSTLAASPTAAQRNQIKARLNTALMNVSSTTYNGQSDWCVVDVKDLNAPLSTNATDYAKTLIDEVINANPDLFYAGARQFGGGTSGSGSSAILSKILVRYNYAPSTIKNTMKPKYESAMQTMLGWVNANKSYKNSTDAEKAKAVHDWLVRNVKYNWDAYLKGGPAGLGSYDPWTAYGAVVNKSPVCEGYSLAFISAMARLGIQASFVQNANHGWNRVRLKVGSSYYWYNLDVTYDDPLKFNNNYADGGYNTTPSTKFFLKSDAAMKKLDSTHAKWTPAGTAGTNTSFDSASWNTTNASSTSAGGVYPLSGNTHTVTSFALSPATVQLKPDSSAQIILTNVAGTNVVAGMAKWTSSNPAVASVSANGTVTSGKEVGTATITVTLGGKTATCTVQVSNANSIAGATVTRKTATYEYKSGVAYPASSDRASWATVKVGATTLKNGTDYTITWPKDMINPGVKTVTFTGKGKYGGTVTTTYTVTCPLTKVEKSATSFTVTYNGSAQKKVPTLTFKGSANYKYTLKEGTDFSVSWPSDMTNAGTKKVTITGKGAWTGTFTYNVVIKKRTSATWTRLWGAKAFDTMESIVSHAGRSSVAIVTSSKSSQDGLAATALAGSLNATVLITEKNSLNLQTRRSISKMGASTVYIIGSTSQVSSSVENAINGISGVKTVKRIAGSGVTARAIATAQTISSSERSDTVIIAWSKSFRDALSISPYAYATHSPIIYAEGARKKATLSSAALNYIKDAGFTKALIVGGPVAVPISVETQLKSIGISASDITRVAGKNAYETSRVVAEWETGALSNGTGGKKGVYYYASIKYQPSVQMSFGTVGIANALGWRDAISATALCGKNYAPLMLMDKENSTNLSVIQSHGKHIATGYVFGGTKAVPANLYTQLTQATK